MLCVNSFRAGGLNKPIRSILGKIGQVGTNLKSDKQVVFYRRLTIFAFYSLNIPEDMIKCNTPHAFDGDSEMSFIEIPNGVRCIGKYAFRNCVGLTSVEIPSSVREIQQQAFLFALNIYHPSLLPLLNKL